MGEAIDRLDKIDFVGAAEKIQKAMRNVRANCKGDGTFLGSFDPEVVETLAREVREKTHATTSEVDDVARLYLTPSMGVKGLYWFDETLDETMTRLAKEGKKPTDDIQWTPHVVIGPDHDAEEKARLAASKKARKHKSPKAPDVDCWSSHPEALFYALMQTSVEEYNALRDAGIIVNGESVKDWPRNRRGEPKVFCNDYQGPAAVNDLIHYLRDGGLAADLAEIGSTLVKIEEVLKKLGLEPLPGAPPPNTPESRLAAAMRNRKPAA